MKNLFSITKIISTVSTIAKYGAIILAITETLDFLKQKLESINLEKNKKDAS